MNKLSFLHNIYYNHVSKCYKRGLKRYQLQDVNFNLKIGDAREVIKNDNNLYNLIFFNAVIAVSIRQQYTKQHNSYYVV